MSASISTTSETLVFSIETDRGSCTVKPCWLLDVKGVLLQCHTARRIGDCNHWILQMTMSGLLSVVAMFCGKVYELLGRSTVMQLP